MARFWLLALAVVGSFVAPSMSTEEEENAGDRMVLLDRGRYIFGTTSTTTYTSVIASTSTVYLSCLSTSLATVCEKRKRSLSSRRKNTREEIDRALASTNLDTSLDPSDVPMELGVPENKSGDADEEGKFGFTVWTTTKTSTTVTVFYTDTATTITFRFGCVAGGMILPTQNCAG